MSSQEFLAERAWLAQSLRCEEADIRFQLIAGDASPRKFYRVSLLTAESGHKKVLMVSPPTENNERFVLVHGLLEAADVRVPKLQRADLSLGFFLLEDLGDITFWSVLQGGDVDALIIASPDFTHAPLSQSCVAAGKRVLCEKPLSQSSDECLKVMCSEQASGGRHIMLGFMRRYDQSYVEMRAALEQGILGRALMMHNFHHNVETPAVNNLITPENR